MFASRRSTWPCRLLLLSGVLASMMDCRAQRDLTAQEFYQAIQDGTFTAIVDVRTMSEWNDGHIENATLVENLASTGPIDPLLGCESCVLGIYCRSGARAGDAITRLIAAGFQGTLYNGQGTNNWVAAGHPLVTGDSVDAPCAGQTDFCSGEEVIDTPSPTSAPTVVPVTPSPTSDPSTLPSVPPSFAPGDPTIPPTAQAVDLTAQEFYQAIQDGIFTAIVDVRTMSEWNDGHIENATLVENLASTGPIDPLLGCESCALGIYCRSGARAGDAITRLIAAGFQGTLYNGQGTNNWVAAGHPLVTGDSVDAPCAGEATFCGDGDEESSSTDEENEKDNGASISRHALLMVLPMILTVLFTP
jgi:phage shock protein E